MPYLQEPSIPNTIPILAAMGRYSEHRPLRASENFEISGAKKLISLKIRVLAAARAQTTTMMAENRVLASDNQKMKTLPK